MAQVILNRFNVVSAADRGNGVGVAQIMEPGIWAADGGCGPFEVTVDDGVGQVMERWICFPVPGS